MIALVQRIAKAQVTVEEEITGSADAGLLVYIGVEKQDTDDDAAFIARKIPGLRIFPDDKDKMNLGLLDISGSILAISNFTLCGNCRKGRRPGYDNAAPPEQAERLFDLTIEMIRSRGVKVETGVFGAHMDIENTSDGPVNLILRSQNE
ncbi:D-tyrosyl-tRNA(Tyr) deacylase [Limihaloglobus sulfuriphilus]|uniref:D-aminoacyl-tRNA deacylase n=1 Tax=Limihaloglobus sulfuriphilus TaxID=1851148 RepID=A0A1Q2MC56_9BACT|nr:D-aminoacyl-tRNA deacylase [Limihaloglobus sulfuriphilus]AQQ69822.1 D-tyrosyl-tRNA(Tyr) deacylase [Limihaloglobus sulfuriphilus]